MTTRLMDRRSALKAAAVSLGLAACGEVPTDYGGAAPTVVANNPNDRIFIPVDAITANVGVGDATADTLAITSAFQLAALAPSRTTIGFLRPARYLLNTGISVSNLPGLQVWTPFAGVTTIRATASNTSQWMVNIENSPGIVWDGVGFDARGSSRTIASGGVACGMRWYRCHGGRLTNAGFRRMLGIPSPQVTANAFAASECNDVRVDRSWIVNGVTTDGFYVSGDRNLIQDIHGEGWGDTLAVLENCNHSTVRRVVGKNGGALAAVSNFSNADRTGNLVEDCVGTNLTAGSGGYRIQSVGSAGGKLTFTTVRRCSVTGMAGPGMWIYKDASAGEIEDVTIDTFGCVNPTTQGLLVDAGLRVTGTQLTVIGPGANGIQVQGSADTVDLSATITTAQSTGAAVLSRPRVTLRGLINGTAGVTTYGAYAYGTCPTLSHDLAGTNLFALVGADAGSTWTDLTP